MTNLIYLKTNQKKSKLIHIYYNCKNYMDLVYIYLLKLNYLTNFDREQLMLGNKENSDNSVLFSNFKPTVKLVSRMKKSYVELAASLKSVSADLLDGLLVVIAVCIHLGEAFCVPSQLLLFFVM